MKTKTEAWKDFNRIYYLLKCPHCGEEVVVSDDEINRKLFEPKEIEEEVGSFSIGNNGEFIDNGKVKQKRMISSDSSKDVYTGLKCCNCGKTWDEPCLGMYKKRCNPNGKQTKVFELTEEETKRAKEFIEKHRHKDEFRQQNKFGFSTLGQQFTYTITPGGLGNGVSIKCNYCGEEENITDIENW